MTQSPIQSDAGFFPDDRRFISPETYDAVFAVIERLEATIEREILALAVHRPDEIADCTRQKRQGFLELDRMTRSLENAIPSQALLERLAVFRSKLEVNDATLRRHLKAAQEVNDIIVRVMQESESDGTYSRSASHFEWE